MGGKKGGVRGGRGEGEKKGGWGGRRERRGEAARVLPYQRVKYQIWGSILEMSEKFPAADTAPQNIYVTEKYFLKLSFTTPELGRDPFYFFTKYLC